MVAPVIRAALFDPEFRSFDIKVEGFRSRPPDAWFHPSTHPLWPERMLYYYLSANPADLVREPFDPHSTMAVTQGQFWHSFIQHVGIEVGIFVDPGLCSCGCGKSEWFYQDGGSRSRGHTDGLTSLEVVDEPEVFEFKTMGPGPYSRLPKGAPDDPDLLEVYKEKHPGYYAQGIEYMRISGIRRHRTLLLSLVYPFPMREIVIPYDMAYARSIEMKYRSVLQAVADQRLPTPCCAPKSAQSKECMARQVCPVGKFVF